MDKFEAIDESGVVPSEKRVAYRYIRIVVGIFLIAIILASLSLGVAP